MGLPLFALIGFVLMQADGSNRLVPAAASHGLSLAAGLLIINTASGLYKPAHGRSLHQTCARAALALLLALPLAYVIFSLLPTELDHLHGIEWAAMLCAAGVIAHRVHAAHLTTPSRPHSRILIFGSDAPAEQVGRMLREADPGAQIVGYFPGPNETRVGVPSSELLLNRGTLRECALELGVDEIVVALAERRGGSMPLRELLSCKAGGMLVTDISTYFEKLLGQIRIDHVHAGWLIFGDGFNQGSYRTVAKRSFDVLCALLLLTLAAPLLLATALAIALERKGPVLYRQERVGLGGRTFQVLKFRSMRVDAEKGCQPKWASTQDSRVTRVGAVIRRFRIDEFPQLVNVLRGEMSLVGPRPERPFFVEQLTRDIPFYAVRHSIKPGLTGWAQVRYQYGATVADSLEKLQYDLYYVKNHSLFLDLVILLETVGVVVSGKGAR
ncbi:MAG: TIGR03013 family XrtA/PEP-CTERM system glycosyltransferase [Burkholderiaceae bacterium]